MFENLLKIYKNKIVDNVKSFDFENYYYFYKSNGVDIFGISKDINENEYNLICSNFIEKKIYATDKSNQAIYEYLFDNSKYPFKDKKVKVIITNISNNEIKDLLKYFYPDVKVISLQNIYVWFCSGNFGDNINLYIPTISFDLGIDINLHEGIYITSSTSGQKLLSYIYVIKNFLLNSNENYTDVASPIIKNKGIELIEYIDLISEILLKDLFSDVILKDCILTYFKNDLNVSKTAKDLYMNRNSLLNKFDGFYKETGFNLQKFSHASALYYLINNKTNK